MAARFSWPGGARAAVTFKWDDARTSQIDHGLGVLARCGVRATFFVTPGGVRQRLAGWKRAVAAGHEIAAHTVTHPCTAALPWARRNAIEDFSLGRFEREEIIPANRYLVRALGVKPRTFSYPCGHTFVGRGKWTRSIVPLIAKHYDSAVDGTDEPMDPAVCDLWQLAAAGCDEATFARMKRLADHARAEGTWLILGGHEIAPRRGRQITNTIELARILRYVTDSRRGFWVGTVSEVSDWIRSHRPPERAPQ